MALKRMLNIKLTHHMAWKSGRLLASHRIRRAFWTLSRESLLIARAKNGTNLWSCNAEASCSYREIKPVCRVSAKKFSSNYRACCNKPKLSLKKGKACTLSPVISFFSLHSKSNIWSTRFTPSWLQWITLSAGAHLTGILCIICTALEWFTFRYRIRLLESVRFNRLWHIA